MPKFPPTSSIRRAVLLLAWTCLLLASGCAGTPSPPASEAPVSGAALVTSSEARLALLPSARIRAVVDVWEGNERVRVRQAILLQQPGRFRIETLSPFDTTLTVVASDGENLVFYDLQEELFLLGTPDSSTVSQLIPVALDGTDVVRVLLGAPPRQGWAVDEAAPPQWDRRRGAWRVPGRGPDNEVLTLWFQHATGLLVAVEAHREDALLWSVATGGFQSGETPQGEPLAVPSRLRLRMPSRSLDLSLEIERYDMAPELSELLFSLDPPRGTTVRPFR